MERIALLCPGQGSQYVGMGKELCENFAVANETFQEANEVLGFDLQKLCFEGDMAELTRTENTQPAILTATVAAFRVYARDLGIYPFASAGHSLGEISALTCADAISFADAVRIVRARGTFMTQAVEFGVGGMAAVENMDRAHIEEVCRRVSTPELQVVVSSSNSPNQTVISGHTEAVHAAGEQLKQLGASVIHLKVGSPFHSPLMQPAADKFREELQKYQFRKPKWDVISNVTARPYEGESSIIDNLTNQIVQPVQWKETMQYLEKSGVKLAVEMGPGHVLRNLTGKNVKTIKAYAIDKEEDLNQLKLELALQKKRTLNLAARSLGIAVSTQNHNFDNNEYQKGVVEPYNKIEQIAAELEKSGAEMTVEQMKEVLVHLSTIFATKKTPLAEQQARFKQLLEETGTGYLLEGVKFPLVMAEVE
jgi:[acyl-carrier-protein] S-malonyltransferase